MACPGVTGNVVQALDPADAGGPSTTDACSPLTNAGAVSGNIALVDRGTCGFTVKVKNAQDAGAIAVIVADNAAGSPPAGLGGADATITISSVRISQPDGNTIKAQLGSGVNATLGVDLAVRLGADASNRALLNAPNPVVPGSSISHYDPIAAPNQLMEPAISSDLTHSVDVPNDLTLKLFRDIGWYPDADVDGVADASDNCPATANPNQADNDGDAQGDVCDADDDNDGVTDSSDNCSLVANADQADNDGDAQGDVCDADDDNDGVLDGADNCPLLANPNQADADGDGRGDVCDADDDGDGVPDSTDQCPAADRRTTVVIGTSKYKNTGVPNIVLPTGCTLMQKIDGCATANPKNRGGFVDCVSVLTTQWVAEGVITSAQKDAIMRAVAQVK